MFKEVRKLRISQTTDIIFIGLFTLNCDIKFRQNVRINLGKNSWPKEMYPLSRRLVPTVSLSLSFIVSMSSNVHYSGSTLYDNERLGASLAESLCVNMSIKAQLISQTMTMFRCTLASLLDSIVRGFCVYNIVLFCTHSQLHMVYITTTATIGGHATFGKPKRFRQTQSFLLLSVEISEAQQTVLRSCWSVRMTLVITCKCVTFQSLSDDGRTNGWRTDGRMNGGRTDG